MDNRFEPTKNVDDIAKRFIGLAIEVHRNLGPGYIESIYERSLCIEMKQKNIFFKLKLKFRYFIKG